MSDHDLPTDEELARRARAGDEGAVGDLFDRHEPRLRASADARLPAHLRGKVAVSDVVQDAYVAAFLELSRFEDRGDGSFGRWLRGILSKKVANAVRHLSTRARDTRREVRLASGVEPPPAQGRTQPRTPPSEIVAKERAAAVRRAVDALPPDQRDVIRLVDFEGLTFAEAGARLERSADAARMLYGRAMDRVADRLWPDETSTG